MVFQNLALFPHKTVAENIEFGPRMHKVERETRRRRVLEVAAMVKITHLLDKMPGQCSGGEAQRVALARTLVTHPSTFLLDEPLSSLDAKLRRELRAECDRLHQVLKRTFIYVTHDQEEAMTLADRIVLMRPEHVGVTLGGNGDIELPVRLVEPLGRDTLLYFDAGTERALVAVSEGLDMADVKIGARMALSLDPRRLYLFGADGRRLPSS